MVRKAFITDQIINKPCDDEVLLSQEYTVFKASQTLGSTHHTDYRWRKECGGMRVKQAWRIMGLEQRTVD